MSTQNNEVYAVPKPQPGVNAQAVKTRYSFLAPNRCVFTILIVFIFCLGFGIRLYDFFDAPLDFHPTRQTHSAIIARGIYYQYRTDVPEWQREFAISQWKSEPHPEPQFLETLTAFTYRLTGGERLWIPRLYSILFWMAGGAALFMIVKELAGRDGALVSLVFYLFLPYSAIASRSFQPDPLMVSLLLFTIWAVLRWQKNPTWRNTLLAGLLGGMAIYIKAVAAFWVAGAWIGVLIAGYHWTTILKNRKVWAAAILSLLPFTIYFIKGMYIDGFLQSEMGLRFFPQLWKDPVFYLQWISELSSVVSLEWFLVALVCVLLIQNQYHRGLMTGLWVGYLLYGMIFAYHISTHDYYQLPLVPIVAIGLGIGAQHLFNHLDGRRFLQVALVGAVILSFTVLKAWDVRVELKRKDYSNEIAFWQTLGERLGQDVSVVGLLQDSGARLSYWGWVDAADWMTSGDFSLRELGGQSVDMQKYFDKITEGRDYFVVTYLSEFESQPKLAEMLSRYTLLEQTDDYLIYDLRNPLPGSE